MEEEEWKKTDEEWIRSVQWFLEKWFESHCPGNFIFCVTLLIVIIHATRAEFWRAGLILGIYFGSFVLTLLASFVVFGSGHRRA